VPGGRRFTDALVSVASDPPNMAAIAHTSRPESFTSAVFTHSYAGGLVYITVLPNTVA